MTIAWPRTILPSTATFPMGPEGLIAVGDSNYPQVRATMQIGRTWTETYPPLRPSTTRLADGAFLAFVNNAYRNQLPFLIDHRSQRTCLGTGAGSPVIAGANQTGDIIETSGWGISQTVLKAGDVVALPGGRVIYDITLDVTSAPDGTAALTINPPVFAGFSPTNGGAITTNLTPSAVKYRCRIAALQMPQANADQWYTGMSITFEELP